MEEDLMLLTMNDLQELGKTLDAVRQASPGGRRSGRPTFKKPHPLAGQPDPDYELIMFEGSYCPEFFKTRPAGDPPSVHGRAQLGIDPATKVVKCVACERGL